jgi:hypothetical protein
LWNLDERTLKMTLPEGLLELGQPEKAGHPPVDDGSPGEL